MVGGIVIEAAERDGRIYIDCQDRSSKDTSAIWLEKNETSLRIRMGDSIWWQGDQAMWTPEIVDSTAAGMVCGVHYDIKIPRIGYSGAELDRSQLGGA